MKLDHATIVTTDIEDLRHFFSDIIGLSEGPRPALGVHGYWLYANGQPLIHLIKGRLPEPMEWTSPRIDHFAFRVESPKEWAALLERIRLNGIPYERNQASSTGELQLFVGLTPGVAIEFVTRLPSVVDNFHESSIRTSGA
jgi:catechol 2,3-dioxygenase-like lactoylglutathione lyase family enzyme